MIDVGRQFDDRLRSQAAIEMIMQRHLGQGAQQVKINSHESGFPLRS